MSKFSAADWQMFDQGLAALEERAKLVEEATVLAKQQIDSTGNVVLQGDHARVALEIMQLVSLRVVMSMERKLRETQNLEKFVQRSSERRQKIDD